MHKTIIIVYFTLLFFSCAKKNTQVKDAASTTTEVSSKAPFTVKGMDYVARPGIGVDSQVGRILTPENKFTYDYGWYSNEGPTSLIDNFTQTFKAYHHQAFFKAVGMDPKTYPIFKEEADIIQIRMKQQVDHDLMFECDNCNLVAEIEFKDKLWYFPYQEGQELITSAKNFEFTYFEDQDWKYKVFRSLTNANDCGLFATPKDKDNQNKMSVTCQQIGNQGEAERFLLLFRMVMD